MKKYLIFGLILFGLVGCAIIPIKSSDENKSIDNNRTIVDVNSSKKTLSIDLDEKLKKDSSRGNLEKFIPISIYDYRGANDEVSFTGTILKEVKKIKIGDNDEVAFDNAKELKIRTSELKDGDIIAIKYGEEKQINLRIRTH